MKTAHRRSLVACVTLFVGACGNSSQPTPPPPPPPPPPPAAQPAAQPQAMAPGGGGDSNFGTITLTTGFMPDPSTSQGTSGGNVNAQTWNPSCRGWVSARPDHIFNAASAFNSLKIIVSSAQDVTLVVQRPDGSYTCNDDAEGTNPIVQGPFAPGVHKIWIGSYNQGINAAYRIGLTELSATTAASLGAAPGAVAPSPGGGGTGSNFGMVTLATGFMPDPNTSHGTSGGTINAATWNPACGGWVTTQPDHIFNATTAFNNLRIMVNSTQDVTLVVQKPDGSFACNDDAEGTNPMVTGAFSPGMHKIWVGSYQSGQNAPYVLGLSGARQMPSGLH